MKKFKILLLSVTMMLIITTPIQSSAITQLKTELALLKIHYIYVGQGDATFLELPNGETMLIDAGESDQADKVTTYIYSQGHDSIDYIVSTHPHSDHIGGMAEVIGNFNIGEVYISPATHTTTAYKNMLIAVEKSGADVFIPLAGDVILQTENLSIEVVAPFSYDSSEYENLNNASIIIRITFNENKFLFMGDAESSEESMITADISCDILKVGHHGSKTSTTQGLLDLARPKYAVISCGLSNMYGHPHSKIINRLKKAKIKIFRTDQHGTITVISDGNGVLFKSKTYETSPKPAPISNVMAVPKAISSITPGTSENSDGYILNTNTRKIHIPTCSSVKKISEINKAIVYNFSVAVHDGYVSCKICKPS